MCLFPKLVRNPKYRVNKKNGGHVPAVPDERVTLVPIGCGRCIECVKQRARNWQVRLLEDIKQHRNGVFITLTFSPNALAELTNEIISKKKINGYDLDHAVCTLAVRRFLERYRKKHKKSLRHFFINELGQEATEHVHLHGIIWTDDKNEALSHWKYGFTWSGYDNGVNYVNEATVKYITKYMTKQDPLHKHFRPIILTSAGIGKSYLKTINAERNKFKGVSTEEYYKTPSGHKLALPIYYRQHIYTEQQREQLWLQRLDKNERFVLGQRIKADDDKTYNNLVEQARRTNYELGYGGAYLDWEQQVYERQRRILKQKEKIQKKYISGDA